MIIVFFISILPFLRFSIETSKLFMKEASEAPLFKLLLISFFGEQKVLFKIYMMIIQIRIKHLFTSLNLDFISVIFEA